MSADRNPRRTSSGSSRKSYQLHFRNGLSSLLYKVIIIGEVNTGKSAIVRRYVHNFYTENYRSTVGVDFHLKILPYNEELEIRLQLWDIAGQERFSTMTRAYFKDAMGAFIVFDHGNYKSFEAIDRWKKELDEKCILPDGRKIPAILLANKCDLPRHPDIPSDVELSEFVQEKGFVPIWYKTSAKTGSGIEEAMNLMVKYIMTMDNWSTPLKENCGKTTHSFYGVDDSRRNFGESNAELTQRKLNFERISVTEDEGDDVDNGNLVLKNDSDPQQKKIRSKCNC